ncbi:MAG: hypothetical protein CBC48_00290 [bacterium TMED88]|nr:MAG: hypothetical protein CBC48_00290 [bacterium TMED88]
MSCSGCRRWENGAESTVRRAFFVPPRVEEAGAPGFHSRRPGNLWGRGLSIPLRMGLNPAPLKDRAFACQALELSDRPTEVAAGRAALILI